MRVSFKKGRIKEITSSKSALTKAIVVIDGDTRDVINYNDLTGEIAVGDNVIINTLASDLRLGSGGSDFVIWNLKNGEFTANERCGGHIMKLRYTPWQFACLSVEEPDSSNHQIMKESVGLAGMPVIAGSLHSQLYAVVAGIKDEMPQASIAYIMTDGAALPITYSRTVAELKERGLLEKTVTIGQAFGGDIEAVNIYSGLQAAKAVAKADIAVVIMGPGIVGTGTSLGYTGIEQGQIINAVASLGGCPIALLRLSFQETRPRHYGLSHHTITALKVAALAPAIMVLPKIATKKRELVLKQITSAGLTDLHQLEELEAIDALALLASAKNGVTTMGRSLEEEPEFFMAATAAGKYAAGILGNSGREINNS